MFEVSLNGAWNVTCKNRALRIQGTVPGDVYHDLLNEGAIEDPFYRTNEADVQWIGRSDWEYSRNFTVSADMLTHKRIVLSCAGLDTLATVAINGQLVGDSNNMFRSWEWDVASCLREGENTVSINFSSAANYALKANDRERPLHWNRPGKGPHAFDGTAAPFQMIRKEACNFGWDWGLHAVTCGIWKDIRLIALSDARIAHLQITQEHEDGRVTVHLAAMLEQVGEGPFSAKAILSLEGSTVAEGSCVFQGSKVAIGLPVDRPTLWWPNNMGEQPLYDLRFGLLDKTGKELDARSKRVGLRTVKLDRHQDEWGESFQFLVNGIPMFAKGANWIPVDGILARATADDYERLLQDAVAANMNMLRVWGGGIYEPDLFYETCSELGLLVWQDFMYACSPYPLFDKPFFDNATAEAEEQVKRLHHHACLALWCGNNEMETFAVTVERVGGKMAWDDYTPFFDDALASVVEAFAPDTDYWPSSPHSPVGDRGDTENPRSGDAHLWAVWHGKQPFEWYRTTEQRFVSEFGFQSFPEPKTVHGYTEEQDRNIASFVMEHHQRSGIGNTTIMQYLLDWYRLPDGFEHTLWTTQILQGMAITYAVEHWRRGMPRTMGSLYWQLNDYWPVASWASIDYHGRLKALHYMARRFYAPILVSGVEDWDAGTAEIYATSDLMLDVCAVVSWRATDLEGKELLAGQEEVMLRSGASERVTALDLAANIDGFDGRNVLLWLDLRTNSAETSSNLLLFSRPKHLELEDPGLESSVTDNKDGSFMVKLEARKAVALWTWLELTEADARFSDNFIHICPDTTHRVTIRPKQTMSLQQVEAQLTVRSIVDTY